MGITIAGLKKERLKTILVILSIAIAVAVSVSIIVSISSIKGAYYKMADEQSSSADLILTSKAEVEIANEKEQFDTVPEIALEIPFYEKEAYFTKDDQTSIFSYLAVDIDKEQQYGKLNSIQGTLDLKFDECAITDAVAENYNFKIGDKIDVIINRQIKSLSIVAIVDNTGICSSNLGRCIVTDINMFEGKGNIIYKIILASNASVESVKENIEELYKTKYEVDYPDGKTAEFLQGINTLFYGMFAVAFLVIIISSVFLKNVIHDYVLSMKSNFSIIKVLGGTGKTIMKIVLEKMVILSSFGMALGMFLSILFVKLMVPFIGHRLDSGNMDITIVWKAPIIIAFLILIFFYINFLSLPLVIVSANSPVLTGFHKHIKEDFMPLKWGIGIGIVVITFAIRFISTNEGLRSLVGLVCIFELLVLVIRLVFPFFCRMLNAIFCRCTPFISLISKGTLVSQKNKTGNMVILFSVVLAFSLGIFSAIEGVVQSINNVADTIYYGNVIVESDYGITDSLINAVKEVDGVSRVENNYMKTTEVEGIDVKVRGIYKENTNFGLSHEVMDGIFNGHGAVVSEGFLNKTKLNVGDLLSVHGKPYYILGTFKSMEHDGKVVLISSDEFLDSFDDYNLNTIVVYKKDNTDAETVIKALKNIDYQGSFFVKSIDEAKNEYVSANSSILKLFYALVFILFISASLIIINSTSLVIEGNRYSQRIAKTLGTSTFELIKSYVLTGLIIGITAGVIGIIAGRYVGMILCDMLNQTHIYTVKFGVETYVMVTMFISTVLLIILSSTVSTLLNLKREFGYSLVEH